MSSALKTRNMWSTAPLCACRRGGYGTRIAKIRGSELRVSDLTFKASPASKRAGQNLWNATARMALRTRPLEEHAVADLVVIGGGFTGCSAALHAAEQGAKVRLLEAETIGHGGSGRNVGLVNAGLWMPPDQVEAKLGREAGAKLNAVLAAAPDLVFSLDRAAWDRVRGDARRDAALRAFRRGLKGTRSPFPPAFGPASSRVLA